MFSRPKTQEAPPPPTIEDTAGTAQDQADMLRRRRGRASAILTDRANQQAPTTAGKALLGG